MSLMKGIQYLLRLDSGHAHGDQRPRLLAGIYDPRSSICLEREAEGDGQQLLRKANQILT